jgi:streptomycin 6-kinase
MNSSGIDRSARERFEICARRWHVTIDRSLDTDTSLIGFGLTGSQVVVVKVEKQAVDDAGAASVLAAFQGDGVVRLLEQADGVLLMERIVPGEPLAGLTLSGRDDEAIAIIADLVARMSDRTAPQGCPTIQAWSVSFDRHSRSGDARIPRDLVDHAREVYGNLARSQRTPHLLHGDLHHHNVLYDATRGWLAIDPKGVVGETEYELGTALRNPIERPDLVADEARSASTPTARWRGHLRRRSCPRSGASRMDALPARSARYCGWPKRSAPCCRGEHRRSCRV